MSVTTGDWPAGVGITLRADALGVLFALLSSLALLAATVHEVAEGVRERGFPGLVAAARRRASTGVFLTGDLFNFYVFFELAMTAAYVLATYGGGRRELGAALVFTAVNLLGTFVFLLSVAGVYHVTGTLDMAQIAERMADVDPNTAHPHRGRLLRRLQRQARAVPVPLLAADRLHRRAARRSPRSSAAAWPTSAPTACCASAASCCRASSSSPRSPLIVIGCASILYGGVLAVSRRTASEMLAYSAIGQVGYVLVAIGVGGPVGFAAAILYTVVNALNKTLLFLTLRMRGALVGGRVRRRRAERRRACRRPPASSASSSCSTRRPATPRCSSLFFLGSALSFVYVFQVYQYDFWRSERDRAAQRLAAAGGRRRARAARRSPAGLWPEPLLALSHDAAAVLGGGAP